MSGPGLILLGGGDHARVVAEAARSGATPYRLLGFVAPEPNAETTARLGLPWLGGDEALGNHPEALAVLAFGMVGSHRRRAGLAARVGPRVAGWATVVHAAAWVSPTARVGPGAVVMAGAVVQTGARIGAHCVVNSGAVVEHDVVLEAHVQVAPGVVLGGGAVVGEGAYLGLGARVRDHVTVGAGAVVGMGAVVVGNVEQEARVMGVPAR